MKLIGPQEMHNWEKDVFTNYEIPAILAMEQAGSSVYRYIKEHINLPDNAKISIICGKGNNGGDGFVAGRYLFQDGYNITCFTPFDSIDEEKDAYINYKIFKNIKGHIQQITEENISIFETEILNTDLIIDAMFGIGLSRNIEGLYKNIIKILNESKKPVISVDAPSGINLETGGIMGIAVHADYTITFGIPKIGFYLYPARDYTGTLKIYRVGFPKHAIDKLKTDDFLIDKNMVLNIFPQRSPNGHKGTFGKVLFIAGSKGFTGASFLSSYAALCAGSGLSYLAIPVSLDSILETMSPEVITIPVKEKDGHISRDAIDILKEKIQKIDAIGIGPGLGTSQDVQKIVKEILLTSDKPMVLDADGINVISKDFSILKYLKTPLVLTPHPGEMGRLIGKSAKEVDSDRKNIARKFSLDFPDIVLVLKGATTIIAQNGRLYYNITGNSGMGTGGSGDILTGIITSLIGQGLSVLNASILGVYIHGLSGDYAKKEKGEKGLLASDILKFLSLVEKQMEEEKNDRFWKSTSNMV